MKLLNDICDDFLLSNIFEKLCLTKKFSSLLVEEIDIDTKRYDLIKDIHENPSIISSIVENQRLFSDKNVYNNINQVLKDIVNEKN